MSIQTPKYPEIVAELSNIDGNAFSLMGAVDKALRKGGVKKPERDMFRMEAMKSGYEELIQTCAKWVTVE